MNIDNPQSAPFEVGLRIIISSLKLWEEQYLNQALPSVFTIFSRVCSVIKI